MRRWLSIFILISLFSFSQAAIFNRYTVGVLESQGNEAVAEVAQAVWERLNDQLSLDSHYITYHSKSDVMQALKAKKVDVVLGPIKAQPGHPGIVFLSSYIDDNVEVYTPYKSLSFWQEIAPFLRVLASSVVLALFVLIVIVGVLVWWFERRKNTDFPRKPLRGIGAGIWFAMVTMTTVGYGDKSPKTFLGRLVTIIWMVLMLFLVTSMTAVITAELTSARVSSKHQAVVLSSFKGERVAFLQGDKVAANLVRHYRAKPMVVAGVEQAMNLLSAHKVAAAFLNSIDARYYLVKHPDHEVEQTNLVFPNGRYAFAMRAGSAKVALLDQALLLMEDTGQLAHIEKKLLGGGHEPLEQQVSL